MVRFARLPLLGAALVWSCFVGVSARADGAETCNEGIAVLRAEIARSPSETVPLKLAKALRVAEREQVEGEFDECLDALEDARRARVR